MNFQRKNETYTLNTTLLEEIKDLSKWKDTLFMDQKTKYCQMTVLPNYMKIQCNPY